MFGSSVQSTGIKKFKESKALYSVMWITLNSFFKFTLSYMRCIIPWHQKNNGWCVGNSKQLTNNWPKFHSKLNVPRLLQPKFAFSNIVL